MRDPLDELHEELEKLRAGYRLELADRLRQVKGLWADVVASGGAVEPLHDLYHLIHNMTGTGGTFGLASVTEAAWALEQLLMPLRSTPGEMTVEQQSVIAARLEELEQVIAEAGPGVDAHPPSVR